MPQAMTFTSLQEDLRGYLERGSSVDTQVYNQLPKLINNAERSIASRLKIQGFINVVTSDLEAGVSVYQKPDRWKETVSMEFGKAASSGGDQDVRTSLFPRGYEYCRAYWPNPESTGEPEFYADYDHDHWLIVPTPDIDYPWQITYYQQPPMLDGSNGANWLTQHMPNVLLYRALLEAAPFVKNDERIPVWERMYESEIGLVNVQDLKRIVDRNVTRQGA